MSSSEVEISIEDSIRPGPYNLMCSSQPHQSAGLCSIPSSHSQHSQELHGRPSVSGDKRNAVLLLLLEAREDMRIHVVSRGDFEARHRS